MTLESLEHHEFANIFPLLAGDDLAALAADISANGLRDPIVLLDGKILDGRNRHAACELAGIEPRFETWKVPETALDFVISKNFRRRHMSESQRAMAASEIANLKQGKGIQKAPIGAFASDDAVHAADNSNGAKRSTADVSLKEAAEQMKIGSRSVNRAKRVRDKGDESLVAAVKAGDVTVTDAAKIVDHPKAAQRAAVDAKKEGRAKTVSAAAGKVPGKSSKNSSGKANEQALPKLYKSFEELLGKAARCLDEIASAAGGSDKFISKTREGLNFAKTGITDFKRAHR